jgi:hypothetical protein
MSNVEFTSFEWKDNFSGFHTRGHLARDYLEEEVHPARGHLKGYNAKAYLLT